MQRPLATVTVSRPVPRLNGALAAWLVRAGFLALLVAAALVPQLGNSYERYPAVSHAWSVLPCCGLFLLVLADARHPWRLQNLDLLVLLSFLVALASWRRDGVLPLLFVYAPLAYLGIRMAVIAGLIGRRRPPRAPAGGVQPSAPPGTPARATPPLGPSDARARGMQPLPRSWLLLGIVVLCGVHLVWTFGARVNLDVATGGVQGAEQIVHGRALYGLEPATLRNLGYDPHYDTYGPFNYEAYLPFAGIAGEITAARLTTLFFDLLTALLLFVLGRRLRGPTAGATLAFAWLAYPLTLYADGLAANDAVVAAALVGALLVAASPARRGALAALAAWTKLTPLALLPLLAGRRSAGDRNTRGALAFGACFVLVSALVFVPALDHNGLEEFLARTFGFQLGRAPGDSIWERFESGAVLGRAAWLKTAAGVAHGLLAASAATLALALGWARTREGTVALAAAAAMVLVAVVSCDGYFAFTYILWFAPLLLAALILDRRPGPGSADPPSPMIAARRAQEMTVSSLESVLITS